MHPDKSCPIHDGLIIYHGRPLMEHERLRTLWSWYFLKLYTQSYSPDHVREQRYVLDTALANMGLVQIAVLFDMVCFLCEDLDPEIQEVSIAAFPPLPIRVS